MLGRLRITIAQSTG